MINDYKNLNHKNLIGPEKQRVTITSLFSKRLNVIFTPNIL
jgi:hypothetical protein